MPLQHELHHRRPRVPKLHPTVLRPGHDPLAVVRYRDRQHKVLVAQKVHRARAALLAAVLDVLHRLRHRRAPARHVADVPILERLVQAAAHEALAVWGECDGVDRVLVAPEALDKLARVHVPDADNGVERSGGDNAAVGRHGDRRDSRVDRIRLVNGETLGQRTSLA
jgi:hypothetical protein